MQFNVEFENQQGVWSFRTFRTQQAADVFAKNAEMQGAKILFCGNPRDVLPEPTWSSVTMDGRFSCD
jgi:hypothetical protein|tara:strand:- start:647 stop:847 length:201 start_codon:yes stop_codon:yes gene_type:complete